MVKKELDLNKCAYFLLTCHCSGLDKEYNETPPATRYPAVRSIFVKGNKELVAINNIIIVAVLMNNIGICILEAR